MVSVSRSGAGMDTSDGGMSDSISGIGEGRDFRSFMSESSEGTLPGVRDAFSCNLESENDLNTAQHNIQIMHQLTGVLLSGNFD